MASGVVGKLEGKSVVVVGGTSGLGFAVAQASLARGAKVIVASSKKSSVDDAIRRLQQATSPAQVQGIPLDLAAADVEDQIVALYELASQQGQQKIDHIVVTAGGSLYPKPLNQVTADDFQNASQVRMTGALLLAKHALRYLSSSASSSFTLTSGLRDIRPAGAGFSPIAPIAAALKSLARCLAYDMKPIRVNSVSLGAVRTEFFTKIAGEHAASVLDDLAQGTLTKSNGMPEEIADIYVTVMTCTYIDGADIVADGGSLLV